jgi:hypothetical protein
MARQFNASTVEKAEKLQHFISWFWRRQRSLARPLAEPDITDCTWPSFD